MSDAPEPSFELDLDERDAPSAPPPSAPATAAPFPSKAPPRSFPPPPAAATTDDAPWKDKRFLGLFGALLLIAAGVIYAFYWEAWFPRDADDIVADLSEGPNGEIVYDGKTYAGTWKRDQELRGVLHQRVRESLPHLPFSTHDLVLVTGDYANPEVVEIPKLSGHSAGFRVKKRSKLEGTLNLVFVVPANAEVLKALESTPAATDVVLEGDTLDGTLKAPNGFQFQLRGEAYMMRLRSIRPAEPDD